jgi:flagellar basal body-associated protein FliL
MADPENTENTAQDAGEKPPKKGAMAKLMVYLVPALALIVCGGAGFAVSRLFGTGGAAQNVAAAEETAANAALPAMDGADPGDVWYYDLEPVVANLNEPGVTRYVRVTLTLEIGNGMAEDDGMAFLEQRTPLLKNWLTLFLSNQTTENIRGEQNLRQVQAQIAETFNQGLFPNAKPCIKRVLFKELSIQ